MKIVSLFPRAAHLLKTSYFEKKNCICNGDNAYDVDIFPDEKITQRSEPSKPSTIQNKHCPSLQNHLNDLKIFLKKV